MDLRSLEDQGIDPPDPRKIGAYNRPPIEVRVANAVSKVMREATPDEMERLRRLTRKMLAPLKGETWKGGAAILKEVQTLIDDGYRDAARPPEFPQGDDDVEPA